MAKAPTPAAPTRMRDLCVTRADLGGFIDPRKIVIQPGFNVRDYRRPENRAHLDSLKIQIKNHGGVYKPLMCRYDGGQAILIDGESRLTAALELMSEGMAIESVPVQFSTTKDEMELLVLSMGSNGGKSFSLWELGIGYKRFVAGGWTHDKIAGTFGVSTKHVAMAIEAAELPVEAKKLLSERAVSPAHAITTIRKRGSKAGVEELKAAVDKAKAAAKPGKKAATVKGTKAPSKKEVAAGEWEKIARAFYKSAEDEWLASQQPGMEKPEWVSIRFGLFKKLAALVEGTK